MQSRQKESGFRMLSLDCTANSIPTFRSFGVAVQPGAYTGAGRVKKQNTFRRGVGLGVGFWERFGCISVPCRLGAGVWLDHSVRCYL